MRLLWPIHEKAKAAWVLAKKVSMRSRIIFNLEVEDLQKTIWESVRRGAEKILR